MNRTAALQLITDLLTDRLSDDLQAFCEATGADPDELRQDVPDVAERVDLDAVAGRMFAVDSAGGYTLHEWANLDQLAAVAG